MLTDQPKGQSFPKIINMLHTVQYIQYAAYYLYLAKHWAFSWPESICTLHKSSYSTSSIDPSHLYKDELIQHSVGIHTVCSLLILSLESFGPLACLHMHTIYSRFSYSTSSIDPLHLCNSEPILHSIGIHILYSISIITLQGLYHSAGPRAYAHYIRTQKAHPSFTNCISSKLQPIQLLCMHTYFMQHISHFLAKL